MSRLRILVALAAVLGTMSLSAASAPAYTVGIGGIFPTGFANPLFLALHVHEARVGVPWNAAITRDPGQRLVLKAWLAAAKAAHVTPLISFSGIGHVSPSVRQYSKAILAFVKQFPSVKRYTPWNEPDWTPRPLWKHPAQAAGYFNALHAACRHCTVLAGDVYLPAKQLRPWLAKYVKALHYRPSGWALHNYYDVRYHDAAQLKVLMKLTHGPIWLDETGGVEARSNWPTKSPKRAAVDERYLFSLPHRFHRISRVYHYHWQLTRLGSWDSALIGFNGGIRPAYWVVKKAAAHSSGR